MDQRPDNLPDFANPPLDEVVLDLQFEPAPGYTAVHAAGVRALFSAEFPRTVEQPLIPPDFETFGGANIQPNPAAQIGVAPVGSRLWFISEDENHILQFQPDRLIANWRKGAYPRFERVAEKFARNFGKLNGYFSSHFQQSLKINQAEVSYQNIIPTEDFSEIGRWVKFWRDGLPDIEVVDTRFMETVKDESGKPHARLKCALRCALNAEKQKAFRLALTFRGKPSRPDLDAAMAFLQKGRVAIVTRFSEITTARAHQHWERIK